ncbi:hypothetical protein TNCT_7491 [Trichonephila clavata]|uniref:Uncharacterized protein n=1 Tax=Trichonephila clavata TaxID=2740835 RepID=A0A8X6LRH4_TRICU|nr:hypothetical protein TNCT_7491 [Trichonephila clavata]
MGALKLRRTPLRTAFTKAVNHLQEVAENEQIDKNELEIAFEQLKLKNEKLRQIDESILDMLSEANCSQEAYNNEFEAIESYVEKMIAWKIKFKNLMENDPSGQKDNPSLVTSTSSSLRLPKIQFQQFSGELTDRSNVKCIICNKRHYAVLCSKLPLRSGLETESASTENSTSASSSSTNVLATQACTSEVLLQTLVVMLKNGNHKSLLPKLKGGRLLRTETEESTERELRAQVTFDPGERLGFSSRLWQQGEATRSEGGKEGIPLDALGRRSRQFERAR